LTQTPKALTAAIASGDTEAFALFYRQWFDFAFLEARRYGNHDEQFCLDIVQDAMMRVIRSIKPMDGEADVCKWMRAVVQSCCYDRLRAEARRARRERKRASNGRGTAGDPDHQERIDWLYAQLAALETDQAQLLSMRFRFGWTLQRIGAALGLKPGAVDGRIDRTLSNLRAKAEEDFHES
jgi:RNA polymerase sigma factor (sigma-70 family)